jgi:hypothetical protein
MVCDEAPAATVGGFNELGYDRLEFGPADLCRTPIPWTVRPASLLRKSILDVDQRASADGWLRCNIQMPCQTDSSKLYRCFSRLYDGIGNPEAYLIADFGQSA